MDDQRQAPGSDRAPPTAAAAAGKARRARIKLLAILAVCAAPVIASYFTYYVIQPEGRTNYGELLDPQRPVGELALAAAGAEPAPPSLATLRGKWVMLTVDSGDCAKPCEDKLYAMRQVRLTAGKDRDRIERVLLLTDSAPIDARIERDYEGMLVARISAATVAATFPADSGMLASDHIFVIDPLGNLMMRFPKAADPNRMKKDISKLLRASRVG